MDIESYRSYCLSKKGATESFPFSKLPDLLVFKVMGKMFSATDISVYDGITLKCDPDKIEELRATYPAVEIPPYLHKNHWNNVLMDGSIPSELIKSWIDDSYNLVVQGLTRKQREELNN